MPAILTIDQLEERKHEIGVKALNLGRLKRMDCNVPPFVVIPSSTVQGMTPAMTKAVIEEAAKGLKGISSFAVRSATLIEDDAHQSYAGQFLTKLDVPKQKLASAIQEVIEQAAQRLDGDLAKCSIIIQAYIPADVSGVAFTRHPSSLRQMLIEYHQGIGEELVSGAIQPKTLELFWTEPLPRHALPLATMIPLFKRIEQSFEYPQDIEWCMQKGTCYLLQSRPITTIKAEAYQGLLYLDQHLPAETPFLYEQTPICEIAPRPSPFTLSILKMLYAANGPIDRVYQRYGVRYVSEDILRVVGNQLYIDRERELHSLFPTHSYLASKRPQTPVFRSVRGIARSLKNLFALGTMKSKEIRAYEDQIQTLLENIPQSHDASAIWDYFNTAYETIFEINLFAEKYLSRLEAALKAHHLSAVSILSSKLRLQFYTPTTAKPKASWIGNGLEINTEEPFTAKSATYPNNKALEAWWTALPEHQQRFLKPLITRTVAFDDLREQGRWLTVGCMNAFRRTKNWTPLQTLEAYTSKHASDSVPTQQQTTFENYSSWTFPFRLTNIHFPIDSNAPKGVSSGTAKGKLISVDDLQQHTSDTIILYSELLTPDLVQYFDRIKGILSRQGGALSHLAIMARESHIPVITHIDLTEQSIALGDTIEMNGETGDINRVDL